MAEHIIRVRCGDPIPDRFIFKQWIGKETGMQWLLGGDGSADVLLVEDRPASVPGEPPEETTR